MDAKVRTGLTAALLVLGCTGSAALAILLSRPAPYPKVEPSAQAGHYSPQRTPAETTDADRPAPSFEHVESAQPPRDGTVSANSVHMPRLEPPRADSARSVDDELAREESPRPEFDAVQVPGQDNHIVSKRKSKQSEPLEIIRDFITDHLLSDQSLKIWLYSDPQRVRFQRQKAVVLRVIYDIRAPQKTTPQDQLFLVQANEVKQWLNTEAWLAQVQRIQQTIAAQERALQASLSNQLAQRPQNC
jgi:hypothetical protein